MWVFEEKIQMNSVVAVVVTYNRKELLQECIENLLISDTKCDILVINNHSIDGTEEYIRTYIENNQIRYYDTGSNLGGAGGFQYGMRKAVELGYEFVWVMDDDCMVHRDSLTELIDAHKTLNKGKNPDYGFLSSKVLWKDGHICEMNVQRYPLTKNIQDFSPVLVPTYLASFVSLFIPTAVIREIGLPIKEFFIWSDDWEYTRRISRKYPCFVATKSQVTHKSASNIGAKIENDTPERLERYRYLYRNDVYLYRREGIKGFVYEIGRLGTHCFRVLLKSKGNKIKKIKIIIGSTIEGLSFNPTIEFVDDK